MNPVWCPHESIDIKHSSGACSNVCSAILPVVDTNVKLNHPKRSQFKVVVLHFFNKISFNYFQPLFVMEMSTVH
jgi:hypothetical protein